MKLTPIDISQKTFGKKMFGLDESEVFDFLQTISQQLESMIHERNTFREALREKELRLHDYKEKDHMLQTTIQTASQMSERLRQDSEREARLIVADAQQKAEMLGRDARDSLKKLYQEMAELKKARMQFEVNLKALAEAHIAMIDQGEKLMPSIKLPEAVFVDTKRPANSERTLEKSTGISPLST